MNGAPPPWFAALDKFKHGVSTSGIIHRVGAAAEEKKAERQLAVDARNPHEEWEREETERQRLRWGARAKGSLPRAGPLISIVREERPGFTTEIPVFDAGGSYLAKVRGTRVYPTKDGEKAGVTVRQLPQYWICSIGDRTAFEIRQGAGDSFRTEAELYTPTGFFVIDDRPMPKVIDASGLQLKVEGVTMSGNTFVGVRIGIGVRSDGSISLGVS